MLEVNSNKWGNRIYEMQLTASSDGLSFYEFRDTRYELHPDIMVSMPIFAIMAGVSVGEINYDAYVIRVKPEYANKDQIF